MTRNYTSTVTTKGQITIPKELRDLKGMKPNEQVLFVLKNGEVTIRKMLSFEELSGGLHNPKIKPISNKRLREIRESGEIFKDKG